MNTSPHNWKELVPEIKRLGLEGKRMPYIGKVFGVSRQRIKQVINKYIPDWRTNYGSAVIRKERDRIYFQKWGNKQPTDLYDRQRAKFRAKKHNALRTGYEWNLEFGDIIWPNSCPVFDVEIDYFSESIKENSPSFDRFDSNLGYVKGNVFIISWRANRIKNDGTADEHRKIADFLDRH